MDDKEFKDFKKSIELVMGSGKSHTTKEDLDLFQKYVFPLMKRLRKISIKDDKKAFVLALAFTATLMNDFTPESQKMFVKLLNQSIPELNEAKEQAELSLELFERLRKEREEARPENEK